MNIEEIVLRNNCCGCSACVFNCKVNAITMVENDLGARVPKVDHQKCIDCSVCYSRCPNNENTNFLLPKNVYAFFVNKEYRYKESASAGVATLLSKAFIDFLDGVVFGASWINGEKTVKHIKVDQSKNVLLLAGSKYVQSDIFNSFDEINQLLKNNKKVLFIGTPCQVDSVRKCFSNNDNLFTIDLICHGVPPITYLKEYIKQNKKLFYADEIKFRGVDDFCLTAYKNGEKTFLSRAGEDLYYSAFLEGLSYRESCYKCKYAQNKRVGDLTIGDFWGVDKKLIPKDYNSKASVVLSNTNKGDLLINELKKFGILFETTLENASKDNHQLNHPTIRHKDKNIFNETYKKSGFIKAVKNTIVFKNIKRNKKPKLIRLKIALKRLLRKK